MQADEGNSTVVHLEDNRPISEPSATTIVDAARFCLAAASALSEDELAPIDEKVEDDDLSQAS